MSSRLVAAAAACASLLCPADAGAQDFADRVIDRELSYGRPLAPCELPAVAMRIARMTLVSMGIERLPEECTPPLPAREPGAQPPDRMSLTGKRVNEALGELAVADPRYAWLLSDGVIVVRPVSAWGNRQHFLHRTIKAFTVVEEHYGVALDEWRWAMAGETARRRTEGLRAADRTEEGNRPFTVRLGPAPTAVSALDAIVRAHGRLAWEVRYCQPRAEARSQLSTCGRSRTTSRARA